MSTMRAWQNTPEPKPAEAQAERLNLVIGRW